MSSIPTRLLGVPTRRPGGDLRSDYVLFIPFIFLFTPLLRINDTTISPSPHKSVFLISFCLFPRPQNVRQANKTPSCDCAREVSSKALDGLFPVFFFLILRCSMCTRDSHSLLCLLFPLSGISVEMTLALALISYFLLSLSRLFCFSVPPKNAGGWLAGWHLFRFASGLLAFKRAICERSEHCGGKESVVYFFVIVVVVARPDCAV